MQRHECIALLEQLKLGAMAEAWDAVSYTHLDVYKRQPLGCLSK